MVFGDISIFEEMDNDWIKGLISKPDRIVVEIKNPRSSMMVNPLKIKHLNNIDHLKSDLIVINLEDGIAKEKKEKALLLTALFLSHLKGSTSKVTVRVNPLDDGGRKEIEFLNSVKPDAIRVPKVKTVDDVKEILSLIDKNIKIHLSIETKEALENLSKFGIDKRVESCTLGIMDMLNSLSIPQKVLSIDNPLIDYILSKFLIDAKIAGIYPIAFTYQDYNDIDGFRAWCKKEKSMGYTATSCLGPKQVEVAHEVFSIYEDEFARANYIKGRFEAMQKEGITGFMDEKYGFIDEPIYKDALLVLGQV